MYIAGPFTQGDTLVNIHTATSVAQEVLSHGLVPFVPHLTGLWHMIKPGTYKQWMEYDKAWLGKCDALLRLPGYSPGGDEEEKLARQLELPVFYTMRSLLDASTPATRSR